MKILKLSAVLFLALLSCVQGVCQIWPKVYQEPGPGAYPRCFITSYDNGHYIIGPKSNYKYSWLIKTDINGDILWEKKIGNGIDSFVISGIDQFPDGGLIIVGRTSEFDDISDPVIIKISNCGTSEWCSVINTPNDFDYAKHVQISVDSCILMLTSYSDPEPLNRIQLFKFNNQGDLLWKQNYPPDSLIFGEDGQTIYIDSSYYLITARCYYPEPGQSSGGFERPYYIKTDTAGNVIWRLVYGYGNGFHGTPFFSPEKSNTNFFYSISRHSNNCDTPAMFKFSQTSTELYNKDLFPQACPGGHSAMQFLNDTTLVAYVGGTVNGISQGKWIKIDTLGNEYNSVFFSQNSWITGSEFVVVDQDQKIACVSQAGQNIYFYKLNSNLEFDTLYTTPFVYDSLCPYPIVSDTIDLDCGVIVNVPEPVNQPESFGLKVFPNPSTGKLTVRIPEYLQKQSGPADFRATTVYYKWGSATVEVLDISGRKMTEIPVRQGTVDYGMDVSAWPRGLYLFRLVFRGEVVGDAKVLVE